MCPMFENQLFQVQERSFVPDALSISSTMSRVSKVSPATFEDQLPETWYSLPALAGRSTIRPEVGNCAAPLFTVTGSAPAADPCAIMAAHAATKPNRNDEMTLILNPPRIPTPVHIMPAPTKRKRRRQSAGRRAANETTDLRKPSRLSGLLHMG